jgi:hypothetical protein
MTVKVPKMAVTVVPTILLTIRFTNDLKIFFKNTADFLCKFRTRKPNYNIGLICLQMRSLMQTPELKKLADLAQEMRARAFAGENSQDILKDFLAGIAAIKSTMVSHEQQEKEPRAFTNASIDKLRNRIAGNFDVVQPRLC